MITVFTPTYNRAHTLPKLYRSLLEQTNKDFEWLVINDGSTDATQELIGTFASENKLTIRYKCVPNGGKHRAINQATELAKGEYFFIVDSDDTLTPNALEKIACWFEEIAPQKGRFAGVSGQKGKDLTHPLGTSFIGDYADVLAFDRTRYGIRGDKAEVFYTHVLRRYKFPEFENENFITEAVVWMKIAQDGYALRYYNDVIYICEYLEDGLTKNATERRVKNIRGTLYAYRYLMSVRQLPLLLRLRYAANYLRFIVHKFIIFVTHYNLLNITLILLFTSFILNFVDGTVCSFTQ